MIVAGFGYRSGATLESLRAALALAQRGAPGVTHVATVADKLPLVVGLGLPTIDVAELHAIETATRSAASLAARGTGSVAEAAALAAAGPGARLLVSRRISEDRLATCAIAQGTLA
ncbi:cobalamin biosynthesis protein [Sphingomonas sp. HT-1]|uniref:cobalamin biosynthesis protein n=1 Tax=unclassified Sphingomonas TaxID=196159 RepID=UPI0002DEF2C7|nr:MULTISPECIES: cobalamin biosynthesis protein [unclassified Sphingomonas]KTF70627.1 precorrin methylase [Sphingomonas sp. WG]